MMDTTLMIAAVGGLVVGVPIGMFLWNMVLARSARSLRALGDQASRTPRAGGSRRARRRGDPRAPGGGGP
jgi:hypothetical protein